MSCADACAFARPTPAELPWIEESFNSSIHARVCVRQQSPGDNSQPLYEIKANPTPVSEILSASEIEPTLLSQHLAVLKRHGVVSGHRVGNAVLYELAHPKISELLVIARAFLADTLGAHREQLEALKKLPPVGHAE